MCVRPSDKMVMTDSLGFFFSLSLSLFVLRSLLYHSDRLEWLCKKKKKGLESFWRKWNQEQILLLESTGAVSAKRENPTYRRSFFSVKWTFCREIHHCAQIKEGFPF